MPPFKSKWNPTRQAMPWGQSKGCLLVIVDKAGRACMPSIPDSKDVFDAAES